jgi:hypothetical protein
MESISSDLNLLIGSRNASYTFLEVWDWKSTVKPSILKPLRRLCAESTVEQNMYQRKWLIWSMRAGFDVQACYVFEKFRRIIDKQSKTNADDEYSSSFYDYLLLSSLLSPLTICEESKQLLQTFDNHFQGFQDLKLPNLRFRQDIVNTILYLDGSSKARLPSGFFHEGFLGIKTGLTINDLKVQPSNEISIMRVSRKFRWRRFSVDLFCLVTGKTVTSDEAYRQTCSLHHLLAKQSDELRDDRGRSSMEKVDIMGPGPTAIGRELRRVMRIQVYPMGLGMRDRVTAMYQDYNLTHQEQRSTLMGRIGHLSSISMCLKDFYKECCVVSRFAAEVERKWSGRNLRLTLNKLNTR